MITLRKKDEIYLYVAAGHPMYTDDMTRPLQLKCGRIIAHSLSRNNSRPLPNGNWTGNHLVDNAVNHLHELSQGSFTQSQVCIDADGLHMNDEDMKSVIQDLHFVTQLVGIQARIYDKSRLTLSTRALVSQTKSIFALSNFRNLNVYFTK